MAISDNSVRIQATISKYSASGLEKIAKHIGKKSSVLAREIIESYVYDHVCGDKVFIDTEDQKIVKVIDYMGRIIMNQVVPKEHPFYYRDVITTDQLAELDAWFKENDKDDNA